MHGNSVPVAVLELTAFRKELWQVQVLLSYTATGRLGSRVSLLSISPRYPPHLRSLLSAIAGSVVGCLAPKASTYTSSKQFEFRNARVSKFFGIGVGSNRLENKVLGAYLNGQHR